MRENRIAAAAAAAAPAPPAAPHAAQPPAPVTPYLGVPPQAYVDAARVAALADAARAAPPSGTIQIERLSPAWCAGYLEEQSAAELARSGVKAYLLNWWGGGRYRLIPQDEKSAAVWTGEIHTIGGPSKWQGQEIAPPPVLQAPGPVIVGRSPFDGASADWVAQNARILEELAALRAERATPTDGGAASAAAGPGDVETRRASIVSIMREHLASTRELNELLREFGPPADGDGAADNPSAAHESIADEALRRGLDRFLPPAPKAQGTTRPAQRRQTEERSGPRSIAEKVS